MDMRRALEYILLLSLLFSVGCHDNDVPKDAPLPAQPLPRINRLTSPADDTTFCLGDTLSIQFRGDSTVTPDSVLLSIGQQRIPLQPSGKYATADWSVGVHGLKVSFWKGGKEQIEQRKLSILPPNAPAIYSYVVEKEYPHDPTAYTQGLLLRNGYLYESTGQRGYSTLRKVELSTGKVLQQHDLATKYFGEGLEYLKGKLYQLTWTSNTGFIYDADTFEPKGRFNYSTQGWGLTTDGSVFYLSDGTEKIYVLDTTDFRVLRTIQVYTDRGALNYLNELEWVEGKIYANVYLTDLIAIINPKNGVVEGLAHLDGLLRPSAQSTKAEVLNGIAYDAKAKRFYLTGKYWPYLYRVKLFRK